MIQIPHQYRSPKIRFTEARLLFEMQPTGDIEAQVKSPQLSEDDFDKLAERIKKENKEDVLENVRKSLSTLQIHPAKKASIEGNINRLQEKITAIKAVETEKEKLSATIKQAREAANAPAATVAAPVAKEKTFVDGLKDISSTAVDAVLPKKITEHMSQNEKLAVAAVATVGIGVLLYSLFFRGKKAVEAGHQAAENTSGGWFKKLLIVGAVGTAAFLGWKVYKQLDDIKKMQQKAEEQIAHWKEKADEARRDAAKLTGEARIAMESKAKELEEKIKAMREGRNSPEPTPENNTLPEKAGKAVKQAVPEGREAIESTALNFLGRGLALLHPKLAEKAGFNVHLRSDDVAAINGTLQLEPVRQLHLADLYAIADLDMETATQRVPALLPAGMKMGPRQLRAVYFLALVAKEQSKNIRAAKGAESKNMTVEQLLDQTGNVAWLLTQTEEKMKNIDLSNPADIASRLSAIYANGANLEEELKSSVSMRKQLEALGLTTKDLAGFALFCAEKGNAQLNLVEYLSKQDSPEHIKKYVTALVQLKNHMLENGALKKEMQNYIKLYAHNQPEFIEPLQESMNNMTVSNAVQLYLYLEKAKDQNGKLSTDLNAENPLIALMMQMKVLGMISSIDRYKGVELKAFLTMKAGETGVNAFMGSSNIPEPLKKMLPLIGDIVTRNATQKGKDLYEMGTGVVKQVDKNYPWLKWVVGGAAAEKIVSTVQRIRGGMLARNMDKVAMGKGYADVTNPSIWGRIQNRIPFYRIYKNAKANSGIRTDTKTLQTVFKNKGVASGAGTIPTNAPSAKAGWRQRWFGGATGPKAAPTPLTKGFKIFTGAGAVLNAGGAVVSHMQIDENNEKIKATNNAALKDVYEKSNTRLERERNVQGTMATAEALALLAGNRTALYFLGPVGAGIGIGSLMAAPVTAGLEDSAEFHALNESDILQRGFSAGQILAHIKKTSPGNSLNVQQDLWLPRQTNLDANTMARVRGYRAYFMQYALTHLPAVTKKDIDPQVLASLEEQDWRNRPKKGQLSNVQKHLINMQKERVSTYANYAEYYVSHLTGGTFTLIQDQDLLPRIKAYADIEMDKYMKRMKNPGSTDPALQEYGRPNDSQVINAMHESNANTVQKIEITSAKAEVFETVGVTEMLNWVHDDLASCELRILQATSNTDKQAKVRGQIAENVWNAFRAYAQVVKERTAAHAELTPGLSRQEVDALRTLIRERLLSSQEINALASSSIENESYFKMIGASSSRLSPMGMLDLINSYRLTQPDMLGKTGNEALPATNLDYYAPGKEITLKALPNEDPRDQSLDGGYLRVDGSMWYTTARDPENPRHVGGKMNSHDPITMKLGANETYFFWKAEDIDSRSKQYNFVREGTQPTYRIKVELGKPEKKAENNPITPKRSTEPTA